MRVCVLGLGEIGLPTALLLATEHEVVGVDVDRERVAAVREGDLPTDDPDVRALYDRAGESFRATTTVEPADAYAVLVPTPLEPGVDAANLEYVRGAACPSSPSRTSE